jgi:hypothetical protein
MQFRSANLDRHTDRLSTQHDALTGAPSATRSAATPQGLLGGLIHEYEYAA